MKLINFTVGYQFSTNTWLNFIWVLYAFSMILLFILVIVLPHSSNQVLQNFLLHYSNWDPICYSCFLVEDLAFYSIEKGRPSGIDKNFQILHALPFSSMQVFIVWPQRGRQCSPFHPNSVPLSMDLELPFSSISPKIFCHDSISLPCIINFSLATLFRSSDLFCSSQVLTCEPLSFLLWKKKKSSSTLLLPFFFFSTILFKTSHSPFPHFLFSLQLTLDSGSTLLHFYWLRSPVFS